MSNHTWECPHGVEMGQGCSKPCPQCEGVKTIDIYPSWFGETDKICNLPMDERRQVVGRMLTAIYGKDYNEAVD